MKIYTITCNNAYNYGAVLQAYALQRYLESRGHKVRIIDYYPSNLRKISDKYKGKLLIILARKILYFPDYHKSKKVFGKFARDYLHLTTPCHSIEDVANLPMVDLYIAGSDQIWNSRMKNAEERAYFLDIDREIRKISYAASVGMIEIGSSQMQYLKNKLQSFEAVSVRERVTNKQFNDNGIESECVIDPVYLLKSDEWKKDFSLRKRNDKYILVYALHHIQIIYDYAKLLAKKVNAKVYVISVEIKEMCRGNNRFFWNPEVEEFLSLVSNSIAVVSNSFHGISFGCIFDKPVHIFDTEEDDPRISNLVEILKLENRQCSWNMNICLDNTTNPDTQKLIAEEVIRSREWLDNCIQ